MLTKKLVYGVLLASMVAMPVASGALAASSSKAHTAAVSKCEKMTDATKKADCLKAADAVK
ncbi:MAG: hypothetical protein O3A96_11825 [Proteobacteria bacterium]|nr:hypothetical protein [Pseudomonadota bacterium]